MFQIFFLLLLEKKLKNGSNKNLNTKNACSRTFNFTVEHVEFAEIGRYLVHLDKTFDRPWRSKASGMTSDC